VRMMNGAKRRLYIATVVPNTSARRNVPAMAMSVMLPPYVRSKRLPWASVRPVFARGQEQPPPGCGGRRHALRCLVEDAGTLVDIDAFLVDPELIVQHAHEDAVEGADDRRQRQAGDQYSGRIGPHKAPRGGPNKGPHENRTKGEAGDQEQKKYS